MIRTPRLILRPWRDEDLAPYAALNADPEVRRWWSAGVLTRAESDAQAASLRRHIEAHGFGFWAVEAPGLAPFIGFVGLQHMDPDMRLGPAIEAGWRLSRAAWGQGFAAEAARGHCRRFYTMRLCRSGGDRGRGQSGVAPRHDARRNAS